MQRNPLNANTPVANVKTTSSKFETYDGGVLTKCKVEFTPVQDLHGYDNPWAGGAGKNKLELTTAKIKACNGGATWVGNTTTINGVEFTITEDSDGNVLGIKVNRSSASVSNSILNVLSNNTNLAPLSGLNVIMNGCPSSGSANLYLQFYQYDGANSIGDIGNGTTAFTPSSLSGSSAIRIIVKPDASPNNVMFTPMVRLSSEADATFEPYSNVCPISGHTEVQVKNNSTTYTINLGGTYYEGTLDVATGELKATRAYIKASSVESVNVDGGIYYWKVKTGLSSTNGANAISSHFKSVFSVAPGNCYIAASGTQLLAIPCDQTLNTLAAANTWCAANQPEFCYTLATPTTIKILPTYINSNVGMNTVTCLLSNQYISTNGIEYKDVFAYQDIKYSEAANVSRYIGWVGESTLTTDLAEYSDGIYFVFATPEHSTNGAFAVLYRQYTSLVILYQTSNNVFSVLGTELTYSGDWYSHIYLKEAIGYVFY